jgi:hypothetical protein
MKHVVAEPSPELDEQYVAPTLEQAPSSTSSERLLDLLFLQRADGSWSAATPLVSRLLARY